jgi:hypothetical protein
MNDTVVRKVAVDQRTEFNEPKFVALARKTHQGIPCSQLRPSEAHVNCSALNLNA